MQPCWATGLEQGGEPTAREVSRGDYAQGEQKGQAPQSCTDLEPGERGQRHPGREVRRVHMGSQLSKLLEWTLGRGVHPSSSGTELRL